MSVSVTEPVVENPLYGTSACSKGAVCPRSTAVGHSAVTGGKSRLHGGLEPDAE